MNIIADKNIPFLKGIGEKIGNISYVAGADFTKESIKDADVLIVRTVTYFGKDILQGSNVKLICSATIGYDHIDTNYCDEKGIKWTNAPGCNSGSVQQYIASNLIAIARKKNFELKGKTIGIIGVGNVGSKVAKACELLGMRVLLNDPPRQRAEQSALFVDIDTLKREADIITFHTPLIKEGVDKTHHLADESFFASLAKKPIIINSARGGIVNTEAIKKALKEGTISGAIIDCWEKEPTIDLEYMQLVDIATPHIAGYSADGKANATRMSLESICKFYQLPQNIIPKIEIPMPENTLLDLNNQPNATRIEDAVLATYNPWDDHFRLVENPEKFNSFRSNYPLRREYFAYTIQNENAEERAILEKFGFQF